MSIDAHIRGWRDDFELDISLTSPAAITGVFGPSGSGKSSLLLALAGLLPGVTSTLTVDGQSISGRSHQRQVALVFQDGRLFPHRDVEHNLRYGQRRRRDAQGQPRFTDVVDLLQLGPLLNRQPQQLSGGERQRVALGRALLCAPRLLLCDEPLSGVDHGHRRELLGYLRRCRELLAAPMLYVSHDLDELLQLSPHLALIRNGRVSGCDHLHRLAADPTLLPHLHDLGLRSVIDSQVVSASASAVTVACGQQHLRVSPFACSVGDAVAISIGAADIILAQEPVRGTSLRNQLPGIVRHITRSVERCIVRIDIGHEILAQVSASTVDDMALSPGSSCWCLIKAEACRALR
ncbi:MAG: molybdenum ABC transporter ATP-binding protein [Planctomycetota bacterium]|jgi:molybdate transport system ATP-binding protein